MDFKRYTKLLQWHNKIEYFDYDLAIDWALNLINQNIDTENILIIASFSKPVRREEIQLYINGALKELKLEEKYGEYSDIASAHYYIDSILNDYDIIDSLERLQNVHYCIKDEKNKKGLTPFYLLYIYYRYGQDPLIDLEEKLEGYDDLKELWSGVNNHFEGINIDNIEKIIKEKAQQWYDIYIKDYDKLIA